MILVDSFSNSCGEMVVVDVDVDDERTVAVVGVVMGIEDSPEEVVKIVDVSPESKIFLKFKENPFK